jgi:hypothetical protein
MAGWSPTVAKQNRAPFPQIYLTPSCNTKTRSEITQNPSKSSPPNPRIEGTNLTKTRFFGRIGGEAAKPAPEPEVTREDSIRGDGERAKCARGR